MRTPLKSVLLFASILIVSDCGQGIKRRGNIPRVPEDVFAAAVSATQIDISWLDAEDEGAYEIQTSSDDSTWTDFLIAVPIDFTGASDTTLTLGETRFYRVRAVNESGKSPYSDATSATTTNEKKLVYSSSTFTESSSDDGTITQTKAATLSNDTFAAESFTLGDQYTVSSGAVPIGLTLVVTRDNPNRVTISLSGAASSHAASDDGSFTISFQTSAFTSEAVPATGGTQPFTVDFISNSSTDTRSIAYSSTTFVEAAADNGSFTETKTATLSNGTFVSGAFSSGTHYSATGVLTGLTLVVTRDSTTQLTLSMTGNAASHANSNDTSLTISFQSAAFSLSSVPGTGGTQAFTVDFTSNATNTSAKSPVTLAEDASFGGGLGRGWNDETFASSSNNSRAYTTGASFGNTTYLKATGFFSVDTIPTGATVNGITAEIEYKSDGGCSKEKRVRLVKGGVVGTTDKSTAVSPPLVDTYASFGGSSEKWDDTWTAADINAANFGVVFAVENVDCTGSLDVVYVDHIRMTVNYTP